MIVRIAFAALFVWVAAAQDVFNAGNDGGCAARQSEEQQYSSRMAGFERRERALDDQATRERGACRSQACVTSVNRDDGERRLLLEKDRRTEEARHDKARRAIDASGVCGGASPAGGNPCQRALLAEDKRYSAKMLDLQMKEIELTRKFDQERADCRGANSCEIGASQSHAGKLIALEGERAREGDRHDQARLYIERTACSDTTRAGSPRTAPTGGGPLLKGGVEENVYVSPANGNGGGGLPLPPDIRKQLMASAEAMDRAADDAEKKALAASNKFFDCTWKAIRADLAFLAQTGYVPAAQIAKSMHEGTWKYITSDVYDNNVAQYNDAIAALQRYFDDPACSFGEAAPATAVAIATHLGDLAVEAKEVQQAADAAVRTANRNAERRAAYGASKGGRARPAANRFNPDCAPNMCFPSALAQELSIETGNAFSAKPFAGNVEIRIVNKVPVKVFNLTHDPTVNAALEGLFGHKNLQGPPLSPTRLTAQAKGIPSPLTRPNGSLMTGPEALKAMTDELRAAGPGSRLMAFLDHGNGDGHVVEGIHGGLLMNENVVLLKDTKGRLVGPNVVFPDASNGNMNGVLQIKAAKSVSVYRTQ